MAMLETTSPATRRKSPMMRSRLSRSRRASPTEVAVERRRVRVRKGEDVSFHFDLLGELGVSGCKQLATSQKRSAGVGGGKG